MPRQFEVRGVPRSIALDGWWLGAIDEPGEAGGYDAADAGSVAGGSGRIRILQLLLIVLLADFLFWGQRIGLSLALFALALVAIAGWRRPRAAQIRAGLICLIGVLPVVDYLQPLSVLFLVMGVAAALITLEGRNTGPQRLLAQMAGFLLALPGQWLRILLPGKLIGARLPAVSWISRVQPGSLLRDWAFPVGGSLVFLALLMSANPVFQNLSAGRPDLWTLLQRAMFWGGIAVLTAPLLLPQETGARLPALRLPVGLPGMGLNLRSVLRALLVFNALISVQMISDLAILVGGARLPGGVTYAEYAQAGAYPLLATAMLAIAFALAARPFWNQHRLIRPLMLLWLVQNIVLTGAAALRLDLYIAAYGLTWLRLYALIWMGLVAAGLGLAIAQMALSRSTLWLVMRAAGLGLVTLYLCAFVNFAAIIAAQNLARPAPDFAYICALGPMAVAVHEAALTADPGLRSGNAGLRWLCPRRDAPRIDGWRDWGLRSWRVNLMVGQKVTGAG